MLSFKEKLDRLEEIVKLLEQEGSLDETLKLFEEGVKLSGELWVELLT